MISETIFLSYLALYVYEKFIMKRAAREEKKRKGWEESPRVDKSEWGKDWLDKSLYSIKYK